MPGSSKSLGALADLAENIKTQDVQKVSMADAGYPSNLSEEDQQFIIRRMMELANEPNNPYLFGDTGMKMLLREKYGMK